jgi:hypothetical protein
MLRTFGAAVLRVVPVKTGDPAQFMLISFTADKTIPWNIRYQKKGCDYFPGTGVPGTGSGGFFPRLSDAEIPIIQNIVKRTNA